VILKNIYALVKEDDLMSGALALVNILTKIVKTSKERINE